MTTIDTEAATTTTRLSSRRVLVEWAMILALPSTGLFLLAIIGIMAVIR